MLPEHAPFSVDQRKALVPLLSGLTPAQREWLSGYLAALASTEVQPPTAAPTAETKLTVLFGTESGNSEQLADRTVKEANRRGFKAATKNMGDLSPAELSGIENLLVIVSTWGEGDPPESAEPFYKSFMSDTHSLAGVRFAVCALGDTSYEKFCQTGREIDARLELLGGYRLTDRQDCDVDFEESYKLWLERTLSALAPAPDLAPPSPVAAPAATKAPAMAPAVEYGKRNPFPSELLNTLVLNGVGSTKETLHLELSLAGSGMTYEPGDSLAVHPINAPDVVQAILDAAKLTGDEEIETKVTGRRRLADALRSDFDITAVSRNVLQKLAAVCSSSALHLLLTEEESAQLKAYVHGRNIIDAVHDFAPNGLAADALASIFRKLPPRLYSIASSPLAHPDEVHLTVAAVRYQSHGRERKGVCSTYLADIVSVGSQVPVFVQLNKAFRLPADGATPMIMVGPGTGVAPFRAFVEHRAALGHTGKNWLIMGDQHYLYDFLYQLEWQEHLKQGNLARLDVAFSRDQPEKIYVQHRMLEHAKEMYAWLEQGAHFYVCGDAQRMAVDVHEALVTIVQHEGGFPREAAEGYVENLKKTKRYHRDVY